MDGKNDIIRSIEKGNLSVGIIGLGYVGLPTAIGFLDAGFNVWGVDVSQHVVDTILRGENPTGDPEINDIIPSPDSENWNITTDTKLAVENCEILIVTVPTPVTANLKPDLKYVISAGENIFKSIEPNSGKIVVLESTVYTGETSQSWLPLIEKYGLKEGIDVISRNPRLGIEGLRSISGSTDIGISELGYRTVSYTHLTLPTKA